jgi:hypothetical protein
VQCKLCLADLPKPYFSGSKREFFQCENCALVQVNPAQIVSCAEEEARYRTHNNSLEDERYLAFLTPLAELILANTAADTLGLDFGSGAVTGMEYLLGQQGRKMNSYDLFFRPETELLKIRYDYLVCSETLEHFRDPRNELDSFRNFLKPGGKLFVQTSFFPGRAAFPQWHYQRDFTHIGFYSEKTFQWMASHYGWQILLLRDPFVIFQL